MFESLALRSTVLELRALCCVRFYFYSSHGFNFSPQIRQRSWTVEELGFGAVLRGIGPEDIVP